MSAWAIYTMLGFYPDCPGSTSYALTTPTFDRVTIHLDKKYYNQPTLVIEKKAAPQGGSEKGAYFRSFELGNKLYKNVYRLDHKAMTEGGKLIFFTEDKAN